MTKLSVNINKVATLRNARGGNNPDVVKVALDCEAFGAEGITVHPRPDERHIRRSDVYELRPLLTTEFNIEGYPAPEFVDLVLKVKPHQVTLVPDAPDQITSNAGWDTKTNLEKRIEAEAGACEGKLAIATKAKQLNYDAIHDTVHEMAKDEARHGAGFLGLYNRFFKK